MCLERCALARLGARRVSAAGDGGVPPALQATGDRVVEHLRRRRIVVVLQVAGYDVAVQGCGCRVVLHLQITADSIAGAGGWIADNYSGPTVLELQIAVYGGTANLVRSRTGGEVPDLQIAVNGRAWAYGEGACADLHVAGHLTLG